MLHLADIQFTLLHLLIVGFNLSGWIWKRTRRLHVIIVLLTATSWFILGIWHGMDYRPLTDWRWRIKEQLDKSKFPASFITYLARKPTSHHSCDAFIYTITAVCFATAALLSLYFNFIVSSRRVLADQPTKYN